MRANLLLVHARSLHINIGGDGCYSFIIPYIKQSKKVTKMRILVNRLILAVVLVVTTFTTSTARKQLSSMVGEESTNLSSNFNNPEAHNNVGALSANITYLNPLVHHHVKKWTRSARKKRRAIKTGGGTFARTKGTGGGGGRGAEGGILPRRSKNRNAKTHGEDDFSMGIMACRDLDHDPYMTVEVIRNGEDVNNTYSLGAVAKISCTPGFGVNLNNETVTCEKGKWKPKLPQCSALPCRVPYVIHGTFYVGSKPLFFHELKPHDMKIDLRCSKGYMIRGPNRLHCVYGEWEVDGAPECVPSGCRLPHLEKGMYLLNYKADMIVTSGTELDYICDDNHQKPSPGSATCDHGEWKPTTPKCLLNSMFTQRNFSIDDYVAPKRNLCGLPPKEELAIAYTEGTPLDFQENRRFPHGMEIMYRCVVITPRFKNRWKITCDDGKWVKAPNNITCEKNITADDVREAHEVTKLINSSCTYKRVDPYLVTYYNDQEVKAEQIDFPFGTILVSRCVDIGKFQLRGSMRRKCISGQWMGVSPKCDGLSQFHDYAMSISPTILFRFHNGSIEQTVDGKLLVSPGTTLNMECLYLRKFGRPSWQVSHTYRAYEEGWTDGIEHRDPTLEYRLTIDDATANDSGIYSCSTPTRHSHQIQIIVKKVNCPPLARRDDLAYSTNQTIAGTKVTFQCTEKNSVVGNQEIRCQASGTWSGALPRCENIECPDISMIPAMVPLAYTEVTRNGTLKKNETAPPKITIHSKAVGGKVSFSCPPGFIVEGSAEAVCQSSGEWSDAMPLCKSQEIDIPKKDRNLPNISSMMPMSGQGSSTGRNWNKFGNTRAERKRAREKSQHGNYEERPAKIQNAITYTLSNNRPSNPSSTSNANPGETGARLNPMRFTKQ